MSEATQQEQAPEQKPERNPLVEKALKEKENWKAKALELEAKFQETEKAKLEEQQKFKELADIYKKKSEELEARIRDQQEREVKATKLNALKSELGKMGIKQDKLELAFKLAPIDSLKYDMDNQIVLGADEVAKQLKDQTPEWFGVSAAQVNQQAPASRPTQLTPEVWAKMTPQERSKVDQREVYRAFGIEPR